MPPLPPLALVLDALLYAVLPAFAVAAVVLAVARLVGGLRAVHVSAAVAMAAGLMVGNYLRDDLPLVPGERAWKWLLWAALAALVTGLLARVPKVSTAVGWLLRAGSSCLAAGFLVPAYLPPDKTWLSPAFALLILTTWAVLEHAARRPVGGALPLGLSLVALCGAVVLIHAHSARISDAATLLAAALGGIAVVAWWFGLDAGAALPAAAVFVPGIMLAGYTETYSELPWESFALVAFAPLTLALTFVWPWTRMRDNHLQWLRLGLLVPPVVTAVALAMRAETLEF